MTAPALDVSIVIPTAGRPSLRTLLEALAQAGARPREIVAVHDTSAGAPGYLPAARAQDVRVLRSHVRGPAAARNVGWRACSTPWVAFLDDDVVPPPGWLEALAGDLSGLPEDVAGSQGQVRVPRLSGRRPTDWERNVQGLERARWATADMAFRRSALARVGGFDERFPRAYREDADLGLRLLGAGYRLARGRRTVLHPVRPAGPWTSVALQRGNADDALMRALHGRGWRAAAGAGEGRLPVHLATTAAGLFALAGAASARRSLALVATGAWLAGTAELAWLRIARGPRTPREVAAMVSTSAVLPAAATFWRLVGELRARRLTPRSGGSNRPEAILFDRDGTLVADVPYNGDPDRVVPMPGARVALDRLRAAGVPSAVVSNQSGVARGLLTMEQVEAVNRRVEELLGPLGPWLVCPHGPDEGCGCRKPAPGLVVDAAAALGVEPGRCALVGDIGADVEAARAAGARAVLVPTERTRREEIEAAPEVAHDLPSAVELLLGSSR